MPLPESHLESLERLLRIHNEELAALNASREAITREIRRREEAEGGETPDPNAKVVSIPILVARRGMIEQEIGVHEALVALGRDQRVLDTLGELLGSPGLAREAARDPRAFAKDRGIEIPVNMALELYVDEDRVSLRMMHYDELVPCMLTWTDDGFSGPSVDPREAAESAAEPRKGDA